MTNETVQLVRNLPVVLQHMSLEGLYTMARCLGNELARRSLDAHQEARALECALLVLARDEHRLRLAVEDEVHAPSPAEWDTFWRDSPLS